MSRRIGVALAATLAVSVPAAQADTVTPDDAIVQGSVCAGPDCVNNESFGFDTIRLKGPSLRFGFVDTSAGAFPSNDWAIAANDPDGGGSGEYLGFVDVDAGTTPLRIRAGAPSDALVLQADGTVRTAAGPVAQQVDGTTTEGATPIDGDALLTALSTLPVATYEFVGDASNTKRIGPDGSAFNTAFGVGGGSDLAPADAAGVALAAAKELDARLADLEGPKGDTGAAGAPGAAGPAGAPGPQGAPGAPGAAATPTFTDALAFLDRAERTQRALRRRNVELEARVKRLQAQLRAVKAGR